MKEIITFAWEIDQFMCALNEWQNFILFHLCFWFKISEADESFEYNGRIHSNFLFILYFEHEFNNLLKTVSIFEC